MLHTLRETPAGDRGAQRGAKMVEGQGFEPLTKVPLSPGSYLDQAPLRPTLPKAVNKGPRGKSKKPPKHAADCTLGI